MFVCGTNADDESVSEEKIQGLYRKIYDEFSSEFEMLQTPFHACNPTKSNHEGVLTLKSFLYNVAAKEEDFEKLEEDNTPFNLAQDLLEERKTAQRDCPVITLHTYHSLLSTLPPKPPKQMKVHLVRNSCALFFPNPNQDTPHTILLLDPNWLHFLLERLFYMSDHLPFPAFLSLRNFSSIWDDPSILPPSLYRPYLLSLLPTFTFIFFLN